MFSSSTLNTLPFTGSSRIVTFSVLRMLAQLAHSVAFVIVVVIASLFRSQLLSKVAATASVPCLQEIRH